MLYLSIPKEISININENYLEIIGPFGKVCKKKSSNIEIIFDKNSYKLFLNCKDKKKSHFYLSLINSLVLGVWKGYYKKLSIIGVGYKAFLEDDKLILKIGFSHNVIYNIPKNVKIEIISQRGLFLIVKGIELSVVNQVAAEIRSLKPVEPYKGKGIRYFNEIIKKKEGKKKNG